MLISKSPAVELAAGQATLTNMSTFPLILIVAFGILFAVRGRIKKGVHTH